MKLAIAVVLLAAAAAAENDDCQTVLDTVLAVNNPCFEECQSLYENTTFSALIEIFEVLYTTRTWYVPVRVLDSSSTQQQ